LHRIFDAMIQRLGSVVPGPGRDAAGDATILNARRKKGPRADAERQQGLPQPGGGRKDYTDDGNVTKVVEWFGFKLHLLVDVKREVSLHEGWKCPMSPVCNAGKKYGLTVRVPRQIDLRRFTPAAPSRLYQQRNRLGFFSAARGWSRACTHAVLSGFCNVWA
jgi:hypothetical protein